MSIKSFREALNEGMRDAMLEDPSVILLGEDIAGGLGAAGQQDAWGGLLIFLAFVEIKSSTKWLNFAICSAEKQHHQWL